MRSRHFKALLITRGLTIKFVNSLR